MLGGEQTNRYPDGKFIRQWAQSCQASGARTALHLCGRHARAWIDNDPDVVAPANEFGRIQVNVVAARIELDELVQAI